MRRVQSHAGHQPGALLDRPVCGNLHGIVVEFGLGVQEDTVGCLLIALGIGAVVATAGTALLPFAIVVAVAAFWSNGVIANYRNDPGNAPGWAVSVSMLAAVVSAVLLVAGLVVRSA